MQIIEVVMYYRDLLYAILLLLSALASIITIGFIWPRRITPGAKPLLGLMLGTAVWSFTYTIHWLVVTPEAKAFWLDTTYLGAATVPTSFLIFTLVYTQRENWVNKQSVLILSVMPILTLLILWTDSYHGLFFAGKRELTASTIHDGGPWFWGYIVYAYSLILVGLLLLVRRFFTAQRLYRRQVGMVIAASLLPWVASIVSLTPLNPLPQLDLPPMAFVLTGIIFTFNLLRGRLLDIVPVARTTLVENMSDSVLVLDTQGRIVDINPAARAVLGKDHPGTVLGQPFSNVFTKWVDITTQFQGTALQRAEIRLEENPPRYFDVQINPLFDRSKRFSGRLITWRDISERKRVEMEREQLITDLDAYAHTVAHDLKSPVAAIIGFVELLLEDMADNADSNTQQILSRIHRSSYKVNTIIDELLLLASIRNLAYVTLNPINVRDIAQEAVSRLERAIQESRAEVTCTDFWPTVMGYSPWVEEVWMNYISNAIKYGGNPPHIHLDAQMMPSGMARFSVRDNGEGIPKPDQEKLFHQFERLDNVRVEGNGLGLSIVRRIAEKLGGEVGVESEVGKGSEFYFTLPAMPTAPPQV
ncbi:MAG: PAS domain-containing protein [Anaerolineaceae bacterium]|nr:PAS domain-containing protein [Anaerolineaceae bacterium]